MSTNVGNIEETKAMNPCFYEDVPLLKITTEEQALYVQASRYRGLLLLVANRVLNNSADAESAVENSLSLASHLAPGFDSEGAFRSWVVRLAMDEALAIRRAKNIREYLSRS
jgi:DNA-directed RNA polymerase specialized sigma24 family protein